MIACFHNPGGKRKGMAIKTLAAANPITEAKGTKPTATIPSQTKMTQINARIDVDVKVAGDAAFANAGYTPTQAIRAFWGFAAKNVHNREKVSALLETIEDKDDSPRKRTMEEIREEVERGPRIIEQALREMGIENPSPPTKTYEELREEAYLEKWAERGLL